MFDTPRGNRLHISIFGRINVGKSSLINAITDQNVAIVSERPGITTDPIYKSMELFPLGPVVFIDTAGLDDKGEVGELRVKKTREVIEKTDLAILVFEANQKEVKLEEDLILNLTKRKIPVIGAINKMDVCNDISKEIKELSIPKVKVSANKRLNIDRLKELIQVYAPVDFEQNTLIGDIIAPGSIVLLVTTQDIQAPKNRLILPQVETIRDILDNNAMAYITKVDQLRESLISLSGKPDIIITDSQVFNKVKEEVSKDIPLTSFSILMARYKGDLKTFIKGARCIENIKPNDKILIAEACTHHVLKDDISREKLPQLLEKKAGGKLLIDIVSGKDFPEDLSCYKLILHCGACMINRKETLSRIRRAIKQNIPITNYGLAFAYFTGIFDRAIKVFK